MKRSRFSEHQVIGILKEADSGIPVPDICRMPGEEIEAVAAERFWREQTAL